MPEGITPRKRQHICKARPAQEDPLPLTSYVHGAEIDAETLSSLGRTLQP